MRIIILCLAGSMLLASPLPVLADAAAEMARKLQNPLANIKALMTDNAIGFDTGTDRGTSFGFQLQPVYAIDMPDKGFTFIPRGVIPIVGIEPGSKVPRVGVDGMPTPAGDSRVWGLSDTIIQGFFAPYVDSDWKWGIGPQLSIPTHTQDELKGPDWGAGIAGVVTGGITENLSFAGIISNHWSFEGNFNMATIQPMFYYNVPSRPGTTIAYNAPITADWNADSDNRWDRASGPQFGAHFRPR